MPLKDDPALIIRKYESRDRSAVRRICCETALMGEPSALFFDDDEIFADALAAYFTDYESESCFVAEYDNNVVGYLLGAKDVRRMDKIFTGKIAAPLFIKALRRGVFFRKKNVKFLLRVLFSLIKGEFKTPIFSKDYPATLHINIIKECRTAGIGSKLITSYLGYLKAQTIKGVHLATMSDKAGKFFSKLNFQLLFQGERSYFRYFLDRNVPVYIYGMQIINEKRGHVFTFHARQLLSILIPFLHDSSIKNRISRRILSCLNTVNTSYGEERIKLIVEKHAISDKRIARSLSIYLTRKYTQKTLNEIASFYAGIKYTGVSQVWSRIEAMRVKNEEVAALLSKLEVEIAKCEV